MRYPVPRPKKPTARGGKEDWGRLTTDWIRDTDIRLHPYQRVPPPGGRIGLLTANDDAPARLRRSGRRPIPLPASGNPGSAAGAQGAEAKASGRHHGPFGVIRT